MPSLFYLAKLIVLTANGDLVLGSRIWCLADCTMKALCYSIECSQTTTSRQTVDTSCGASVNSQLNKMVFIINFTLFRVSFGCIVALSLLLQCVPSVSSCMSGLGNDGLACLLQAAYGSIFPVAARKYCLLQNYTVESQAMLHFAAMLMLILNRIGTCIKQYTTIKYSLSYAPGKVCTNPNQV